MTNPKDPKQILFILSQIPADFETTLDSVREEGFLASAHKAVDASDLTLPETLSPGTLVLTDLPPVIRSAKTYSVPCAGLRFEGDAGQELQGVPFVVEEADQIERDDWVKLYQRCAGLPWEILTTKRLRIRELTESDKDALSLLLSEDTAAFLAPLLKGDSLPLYIRKVYSFYGSGYWAVLLKDTEELIGIAGFGFASGTPELGYLMGEAHRGRGYAREAVEAVVDYAERALGIGLIRAVVEPSNKASLSILSRAGFEPVRIGPEEILLEKRTDAAT